ncbi:VOC family protein [Piscibacillus sp. B03]|uniref:VOC family protein n=1 Tax=Piscibacillus sp. B03 TaxID=3457430 RepID=UPI003FCC6F09
MKQVSPFLMFQDGRAEEALNFYTNLIEDSQINEIIRSGKDDQGEEDLIMRAVFMLKDQEFICMDSSIKHEFDFTPSFSIFLECDSEDEIEELFQKLSAGGNVLMPLDQYDFSRKFGWLNDRFGVSWQLNLS